ncbi:acetylornithine/succinyldiaminopimelate/putrescine aminotransferase [Alkalispirillum mobile]|uniref:Acetylornithine/succinyldiaminopimelate/putresci ne aminotransferase n=1 Tax=Alkalispirillum mobile TaxID=85925 RepID=A0A498CE14_9GAMM|nr:aminotransferase class III-fold pyridoxal phosphate-dependent enzyme [Alkalispirillum mobile]RLK51560.1 acetylornithine/succinyldiaminopimelate/putrescine aminotransferase [Alkalispirillum mobile]
MTRTDKKAFLERTKKVWNPGKTADWQRMGVDIVIDRREGYCFWDLDGRRLINMHLNGGVYNLGHRNPEVIEAVTDAMQHYDIGNHHFPSVMRTRLAEALLETAPAHLQYAIFASGGGEAIDIALKTARAATGRRRIVSLENCYHGHTGLAVKTGAGRFSERFLCEPEADQFTQVPIGDLEAMEAALAGGDVACVILETIPATYGFPMPDPDYLRAVKALCEQHGALYVADEVQTGLMRTGRMWAIDGYGVAPDLLVTGKGLSGGIYPIAAVLVTRAAAGWLHEDGWAHMSTFGGSEIGCAAALKTLEITGRPATVANVRSLTTFFAEELAVLQRRHAPLFSGVRQNGLVMGLEFDHPNGAEWVMHALFEEGVWAIFSALDPRVLQFKPGLLMEEDLAREVIGCLDRAIQSVQQRLAVA